MNIGADRAAKAVGIGGKGLSPFVTGDQIAKGCSTLGAEINRCIDEITKDGAKSELSVALNTGGVAAQSSGGVGLSVPSGNNGEPVKQGKVDTQA